MRAWDNDLARGRRGEDLAWAMTCDPATTTLYDVYAACDYRLPGGEPLPGEEATTTALIDRVNAAVRERFEIPLSEIFPPATRSNSQDVTGHQS